MNKFAAVLAFLLFAAPAAWASDENLPAVTVWKSPSCGCCQGWADHMNAAGFSIDVRNSEDLDAIKQQAGVPSELQSCHTARVGGYTIEGHVPAADIKRLLAEQPEARGLAVPGMPSGSPGMENGMFDAYDVLLIKRDGSTEVFGSYN